MFLIHRLAVFKMISIAELLLANLRIYRFKFFVLVWVHEICEHIFNELRIQFSTFTFTPCIHMPLKMHEIYGMDQVRETSCQLITMLLFGFLII